MGEEETTDYKDDTDEEGEDAAPPALPSPPGGRTKFAKGAASLRASPWKAPPHSLPRPGRGGRASPYALPTPPAAPHSGHATAGSSPARS
ncbi:hypothetical protein PHYC_02466 [Phycisphaerales bacterium]|nr:hypothetical protein PHYC_02466 [Phycisphaerales bacterium]